MNLTVLIAEDDPAMRQVISGAVMGVPGVEVVGQSGDGMEALELYEELRPRVVMVDIDLPGKSGLDLAREIFDINPWTYLVFCTGYSDYRDKAFEIYAFDYLVKPFRVERIGQTMSRILAVESAREGDAKIDAPVSRSTPVQGARLFRDAEKFLMIDLKDIVFITRENRKTMVHYVGGKVLTDETLGTLEDQLRDQMFFRAHKGFLINLHHVKELVPCGKSTYQVVMANTRERPLITWDKLRELEKMTKGVVV
ncbi:MAG: LytTR family transcriptional regulator [Peptococcaceae bacterium BICA1-7]|nr:MAG: LytTR family transcriptional regulator [Peptococcaceae bacterium BICA1-7]HBV98238.1 DNA-binding response regulator [Desulfotomaculum sp.]